MVLLSLHGLAPAQIAALLDCQPATVRRWMGRFNGEGNGRAGGPAAVRTVPAGRPPADLADRRAAGPAEPVDPAPDWAVSGLAAGQPANAVPAGPAGGDLARPKLAARGDPGHDHVVAGIVARLLDLPHRSVVLAEDETHLNLLPHVRRCALYCYPNACRAGPDAFGVVALANTLPNPACRAWAA